MKAAAVFTTAVFRLKYISATHTAESLRAKYDIGDCLKQSAQTTGGERIDSVQVRRYFIPLTPLTTPTPPPTSHPTHLLSSFIPPYPIFHPLSATFIQLELTESGS
jgi:hypothetical protein